MPAKGPAVGVQFPVDAKGARSSTDPAKKIWCAAHEGIPACAPLIKAATAEKNWRAAYGTHAEKLVLESWKSGADVAAATAGLAKVHDTFEFVRGDATLKMKDFLEAPVDPARTLATAVVTGSGPATDAPPAIAISDASGEGLAGFLNANVAAGHVEPDVASAITSLAPDAVAAALKDTVFVILGATSELCPLVPLLKRGLSVVGVARPNAARQAALVKHLESAPPTASLTLPVPGSAAEGLALAKPCAANSPEASAIAGVSGCDIIDNAPEVARWLAAICPGKRLVVGSYIYLDGADHVRASVAMDAVVEHLVRARPDTALAYLGTPSNLFPIPEEAWKDAKSRFDAAPLWHGPISLTLGRFHCNAQPPVALADGTTIHYFNGISHTQGPNYLLAKTIQNWRAIATRSGDKRSVSVNICPTARTVSVMHAHHVARAVRGMEAFAPMTSYAAETARDMMALLLLFDLTAAPTSTSAHPDFPLKTPTSVLGATCAHGGLVRAPYTLESIGKAAYFANVLHIA